MSEMQNSESSTAPEVSRENVTVTIGGRNPKSVPTIWICKLFNRWSHNAIHGCVSIVFGEFNEPTGVKNKPDHAGCGWHALAKVD